MRHKERNYLPLIFVTVLIDCIGMKIIYPVIATIIAEVGAVSITKAVTYSGWMMASFAVMQFIFAPILGALSDRYGRKPVLIISLLGLGIDYLFLASANSILFLFVGRTIAGICGASITTSFAYVADISKPEKRAQNFGIIAAAMGCGFIIGPLIGGILSEYGSRVPFIAAAVLSALNCLYVLFILPESLQPENKKEFSFRSANVLYVFQELTTKNPLRRLLLLLFFLFMAGQVMPAIWPFFAKYRYTWTDLEIGYSLAYVGALIALVKVVLVKWSQKKFGLLHSIYIGLGCYVLGLSFFAVSSLPWAVYLIAPVYCIGGLASPFLQGLISAKTPASEQGKLQGTITSLLSLAGIISPLLMTNLFHSFTKPTALVHFPGVSFAAAAVIIFLGALFCLKELKKNTLSA